MTLFVVAQSAAAVAPPPPPRGNVVPTLDAVPSGTVGVAAASAPVEGRVAVLVQNAETRPVRFVRVTGTAMLPDGRSAHATTADIVPSKLVPGAIGVGLLRFRPRHVRGNPTLAFRVKASRSRSDNARDALDVRDITLTAPLRGTIAQRLNLTVFNPGKHAVRGPARVRLVCFGESGRPTGGIDRVKAVHRLAAGAAVDVRINLRDLCPSYLLVARGARRR
jgi:hypothetical protein